PTQPPPTAAWQHGVWRRDFDHGIALVNPKGNGAQTVTLETPFHHLTGQQNPSLDDGAAVTTITLQDRDGLLLARCSEEATAKRDHECGRAVRGPVDHGGRVMLVLERGLAAELDPAGDMPPDAEARLARKSDIGLARRRRDDGDRWPVVDRAGGIQ